jgi:hypothetical protein
MNTFKNIVHHTINYLPVYETVHNNKFKYEIYKMAQEIAIIRFIKMEKK